MRKTVNVTWLHINDGKHDSSDECMVAYALLDAGFSKVNVHIGGDPEDSTISLNGCTVPMPEKLDEHISDWEFRDGCSPFSFDVVVEGKVVKGIENVRQSPGVYSKAVEDVERFLALE